MQSAISATDDGNKDGHKRTATKTITSSTTSTINISMRVLRRWMLVSWFLGRATLDRAVVCSAFMSSPIVDSNHVWTNCSSGLIRPSTMISTSYLSSRIAQRPPMKSSPSFISSSRNSNFCLFSTNPPRPQDNLVSGLAEIGMAFSLGMLWSEYNIISMGCGPINFSDTLERVCYQGVIAFAGASLFNRIVTGGKSLEQSSEDYFGSLQGLTLWQVRVAEWASALAVLGAFVALGFQYSRDVNMDGLSGIDVAMCRALRDL